MSFNPRTRMGCDRWETLHTFDTLLFQSTHPHGVRHTPKSCNDLLFSCFNPRTRMGCDVVQASVLPLRRVSIHAPAWGATRRRALSNYYHSSFNPRTRMGCDGTGEVIPHVTVVVSIHAPAWGATHLYIIYA